MKLVLVDEMSCTNTYRQRRSMVLTVAFLGCTILAVFLAYVAFGEKTDESGSNTVLMTSLVFRHGDRAPSELYPNDPHIDYNWPAGLHALSEKGSLQMFNLGSNLRKRYFRLIPANGLYSESTMRISSSASERAMMSAQAFLAGFLPPIENQNKLPINWQPAAIFTIARDRDNLITQKMPCAQYDRLYDEFLVNPPPEIYEMNEKSADLYSLLSKSTGLNITKIQDVERLFYTLEIERDNGLELPEWTRGVFPEKMLPMAERTLTSLTETPYMKRIKGGALLQQIIENMLMKKSNHLTPDRRIFIYSGHDVTLVNTLRALEMLDQAQSRPKYAATLAIELHRSDAILEDLEVKILYYFDSEDREPKEMLIPNCTRPCSLTDFISATAANTVRNYEEECRLVRK